MHLYLGAVEARGPKIKSGRCHAVALGPQPNLHSLSGAHLRPTHLHIQNTRTGLALARGGLSRPTSRTGQESDMTRLGEEKAQPGRKHSDAKDDQCDDVGVTSEQSENKKTQLGLPSRTRTPNCRLYCVAKIESVELVAQGRSC